MEHKKRTFNKSQKNGSEPLNKKRRQEKQARKQMFRFNRKARLIVRNLSFRAKEETFRKHFEPYGEVEEITLLKRPNGDLVGCGFVQFKNPNEASNAILKTNAQPFLGRPIHVDWAVAKDTYVKQINKEKQSENKIKNESTLEVKAEPESDYENKEEVTISPVDISEMFSIDDEVKKEDSDDEVTDEKDDGLSLEELKEEVEPKREIEDSSASDSGHDSTDVESSDSDSEDNDGNDTIKDEEETPKPRLQLNDATDGKTIFIKNVPFEATNSDVRECMEQFGPTVYAIVNVDKMTEHSKGTAFVRFKESESADRCLAAGTELRLLGQVLDPHLALSRQQVQDKTLLGKKKPEKDSRHLYMIKEGVVLAGSKAAEGVSASDMAKRLQLEHKKSQMLRNFNRFVSRFRLTIHNLPENYDDAKLRALCSQNGARVREARVMRENRPTPNNLTGASKGFGFVSFGSPEDALTTLRRLNNNPNIFSKHSRPIVGFSIEDKAIMNAKQSRLQKSLYKNPNSRYYEDAPKEIEPPNKKHKPNKNIQHNKNVQPNNTTQPKKNTKLINNAQPNKGFSKQGDKGEVKPAGSYTGVNAKPGPQKMRTKFNLRTQAQSHAEHLKKEKRNEKMAKKNHVEHIRQPRQKQTNTQGRRKKRNDDESFSNLIRQYKSKLSQGSTGKSKWYES